MNLHLQLQEGTAPEEGTGGCHLLGLQVAPPCLTLRTWSRWDRLGTSGDHLTLPPGKVGPPWPARLGSCPGTAGMWCTPHPESVPLVLPGEPGCLRSKSRVERL